ncbi:MAG TPA: SRPBCC family protein [Gaiellaceae bacterium]
MTFDVEAEVSSALADAFDKMADARNETRWNSQVSRSDLVGDEPIREGSRFATVNRGKEYTATIRTYDKPNRLVFEVAGAPMDITATFTFRANGEKTALKGQFDMRPKGFLKAIFPLMKPVIRKDLAKQSQSFKRFCESS